MHKYWFIITLLVWSCSPLSKLQKQENKVAKKLKKLEARYPDAFKNSTTVTVRIDTVIKEVRVEGKTKIDTVRVTDILKEYISDTVEIPQFITRFLEATKDTVKVDTLGIHLWLAGSGVEYRMRKDLIRIEKEQEVRTITVTNTQVLRKRFYQDWLFWLLIITATVLYVLSKMGKITIKLPKL